MIAALALPFVTCLVLPHQVAQYVPSCVLKSRWFNVSLIVLLVLLLSPWAVLFAQVSFGKATKDVLFIVLVSALLSLLISIGVLVYSYVGLFQKRDRDQQRLRVAQLVLSLGLTVLALPTTYFIVAVVGVPPG